VPERDEDLEDVRGFRVDAADGPLGTVSDVTSEHITVKVRRGLARRDELLVQRLLIEDVDPQSRTIRLSPSRAELEDMLGIDPERGLGAWFGGTTSSAQQPFPPTLPGPTGAPDEEPPDGRGLRGR
jgi:hypothetical protein